MIGRLSRMMLVPRFACLPVRNPGAGVDTRSCRPHGRGFARLCSVWKDENFDPDRDAYYYARVIENPSCRWNTYFCNAQGVDCSDPATISEETQMCCSDKLPKTIQERAWTSPIWYSPSGDGSG